MWMRGSPDSAGVNEVMCQGRAGRSAASAVPIRDTGGCGSTPTPVTSLQEFSKSITNVELCKNIVQAVRKESTQETSRSTMRTKC